MLTVLGIAVHTTKHAATHGSGSSLAEILGITGSALTLTVLWIATRFLPRGKAQPALTVAQPAQRASAPTSRVAEARSRRRMRDGRTTLAR